MVKYHIISLITGYILDLIIGDPYNLPHPVRWIGALINGLKKRLLKEDMSDKKKGRNGRVLVILTILLTGIVTTLILVGAYYINLYLGIAVESIMTCQILATKSLRYESMKVYRALKDEGIEKGRYALSMIVGRDTEVLDDTGIAKACVETIAENTSDGVIAPLIYLTLGGPVLGMIYKAINTMDSMIGYKNDEYLYFGRCAAKLDDLVNYLPSRISAFYMILSAYLLKDFSGKEALRIHKRDRYNHSSPNSAQTESACAGAMGVRLAGDAYYFGKLVRKPYIGDDKRPVVLEDVVLANRLMYMTSFIGITVSTLILAVILMVVV